MQHDHRLLILSDPNFVGFRDALATSGFEPVRIAEGLQGWRIISPIAFLDDISMSTVVSDALHGTQTVERPDRMYTAVTVPSRNK